jgi:hypothetical protein
MTWKRWRWHLLGIVLVMLAYGVWGNFLGKDANYDLRSYHWYNPYAYLNDRYDIDFAPANIHTFRNPLLDVPIFVLAQHLNARSLAFVLAAVQALNLVVTTYLGRALLAREGLGKKPWASFLLALTGSLGVTAVVEIGRTFGDNFISVGVLASLLLLIKGLTTDDTGRHRSSLLIAAGAFILGATIGLKLTAAMFGVAAGVGLLLAGGPSRLRTVFTFGVASALGLLATDGAWMWMWYSRTGNPIFPFENKIFRSPFAPIGDFEDPRYLPNFLLDGLTRPVADLFYPRATAESPFADARIPLMYIALLAALGWAAIRIARRRATVAGYLRPLNVPLLVGIFCGLGLMLGTFQFGIYRYLVTLEFLSPLVVTLVLLKLVTPRRLVTMAIVAIALGMVFTASYPNRGRAHWSEDFMDVKLPAAPRPEKAMVLIVGKTLASWAIPSFPSQYEFLNMDFYRYMEYSPVRLTDQDAPGPWVAMVRHRVREYTGPMYVLYGLNFFFPDARLKELGFLRVGNQCGVVNLNSQPRLLFCPISRIAN